MSVAFYPWEGGALGVGTWLAVVTTAVGGLLSLFYISRRPAVPALVRDDAKEFRVLRRRVVNTNVTRPVMFLTIGVATGHLPTGSHIKVQCPDGTERSYTPTRFNGNECELLLRVYPAPAKVSNYLYSLKQGDFVRMRGPTGLHRYGMEGAGTFSSGSKKWSGIKDIIMIAGGTGVTPMMQIINHIIKDHSDNTRMHLLMFNSTESDMMLVDALQLLARCDEALQLRFYISSHSDSRSDSDDGERRQTVEDGQPSPKLTQLSMRDFSPALLNATEVDLRGDSGEVLESHESTMCIICGPNGFSTAAKKIAAEVYNGNVLVW